MKVISPYQGSTRKEIEQLYLDGGRTWIFNPEDLWPEDRDDKWLHRELVQEQISHYRQDYWVVLGYLEIMDPWLDEQGRTVIEVCVTDRLIQAYKCLKQGVHWSIETHEPVPSATQEYIKQFLNNHIVPVNVIQTFGTCVFPELDALKKELILFKLSARYDQSRDLWTDLEAA